MKKFSLSGQALEERLKLLGIIDFMYWAKVLSRRGVYAETIASASLSKAGKKNCEICGKRIPRCSNSRGMCRDCYTKVRSIPVEFTCRLCGKISSKMPCDIRKIITKGFVDMYCSQECSMNHHATKNRRKCETCGKPCPVKHVRFCSKKCKPSRKTLLPIQCDFCSKSFQPISHRTRYCSKQCQNSAHSARMIGDGNSHFKDGTSYAKWFRLMRPLILERDHHQCVNCNGKNGYGPIDGLQGHHIDENPRNNNSENLIMLCKSCHMIHHKSNVTPFPWLAEYAKKASQSMTSKWKETVIFLQTKFLYTIA